MSELTDGARDLVEEHLHIVGYHVAELISRMPGYVTRDELASAGYLALVQAASSYSDTVGVPFARYASIRIKGALLDELRSMDWLSRNARKRVRDYVDVLDALTVRYSRTPTHAEVAHELGVSPSEVIALLGQAGAKVLSFEANEGFLAEVLQSENADPESETIANEQIEYLRCAIDALPGRLRFVIEEVDYRGGSVTDVALKLGVTQSRVSQLRAEALHLLRDGMNSNLDPERVLVRESQGVIGRRRESYFGEIRARVAQLRKGRQTLARAEMDLDGLMAWHERIGSSKGSDSLTA